MLSPAGVAQETRRENLSSLLHNKAKVGHAEDIERPMYEQHLDLIKN